MRTAWNCSVVEDVAMGKYFLSPYLTSPFSPSKFETCESEAIAQRWKGQYTMTCCDIPAQLPLPCPMKSKNTWVQMTFQFAVVQCNCVLLKLKRGREACACSVSGAQMLAFFLWNAAAYFSFHGHCTKVLRTSHLWLCCDTPWQSTKKSFDENCSIHRVQTLNWNLVLNGRSAHSSKTQAHKLVGLRLRHRFKQYRLSFLVLLGPYIICFLSSIFWRKNTSPGANESQVKMCEQAVATDKTTKQAQSMETRSLPQERTPNNNIKG